MKILFISESFGSSLYGVAQVIVHIIRNCSSVNFDQRVLAYSIDSSDVETPKIKQVPVYKIGTKKCSIGRLLRFHHKMLPMMESEMREFSPDVVHIHGALTFIQCVAVIAAKRNSIPVVVSPHGMLEPWTWLQNGKLYYLLKRLFWLAFLRPFLKHADFVHAITDHEAETLDHEFSGVPQIRITNAIDLSEYTQIQIAPDAQRYLLFVGRLHPKKGVELLIEAFNKASVSGVRLIIAGPDFDVEYTAKLKLMVRNFGLSEMVSFVGSVHGEKKNELLQKAWCTVVPSYSDVVALVNLESTASFTPTITTTMTGLSDWQEGGGLLVEPELEPLKDAIITVCNWTDEKRMQIGEKARAFVEERYSWDMIGPQWIEAYKMIAESGKNIHV